MPDIGDIQTATLTVSPFSGTTTGVLTVYAPDGTTSTPAVSGNGTGTLTATVTYSQSGWYVLGWVVTGTGAGVEDRRVFVAPLPISGTSPAYATLEKLKTRLRITDAGDDDELTDALNAAAWDINNDTGRRFNLDSAVSARIYDITHERLLLVDDIATATGLIVEVGSGSSFSAVDSSLYRLLPQNALADGRAAEAIERVNSCWPLSYGYTAQARITAQWGWPAVPPNIEQANLLRAQRLFRRKDSPEGVAGFNDLGVVRLSRYDSDYEKLICSYIKDRP